MGNSDYSKVTNDIREQLVANYLRQHPNIRRDQIVIRYVNGKAVCEDITKSFENKPASVPSIDPAQLEVLAKLQNGGDKKYASSLQSLQTAEEYLQRLMKSPSSSFNDVDYNDNHDQLQRKKHQTATCALEVSGFKKKLNLQSKSDSNPSESVVRLLMMEYFETSIKQLRCIESIYIKEAHLLNQYVEFATLFIKDTYNQLKTRLDEKSVNAVKKALGILKRTPITVPDFPAREDIIDKEELKIYAERLHEFEQKLIPKRSQIQPVMKLVAFLEDKLQELDEKQSETEEQKTARMALWHKSKKR